jgi:hypothetical protein
MTTKAEFITQLKAEYPTLKTGSDEDGYTDLDVAEYEATISSWADNLLADETKVLEAEQAATAKAALLARLGITAEEFKTLLGDNK